ncbi:hypothetical protein [Marinobacter zhejiangensis]|uniref:hypothetical protein n=1 Tax=Marinobacter zhejiangensis TaxID=488535 RepID=UPI00111452FF|nr:hypothetical protein [Marinobacter zhejiangensis]
MPESEQAYRLQIRNRAEFDTLSGGIGKWASYWLENNIGHRAVGSGSGKRFSTASLGTKEDCMELNCNCNSYEDLPLDLAVIQQRVLEYQSMKKHLKQLTQKIVERWVEHYRLFRCEVCGQYWQSSLAPRDDETWYLFRVPNTTQKSWKERPYISPDMIVLYFEARREFLSKDFGLSSKLCKVDGCKEFAISGLNKCQYHQFLQIEGQEEMDNLLNKRWFGPYSPDLIKNA